MRPIIATDVIAIVISAISFCSAIVAICIASSGNKTSLVEAIRNSLSAAKERVNIAIKEFELNKNTPSCEVYRNALLIAIEDLLSLYDEACFKYLNCKIDRAAFKRMYRFEIKRLVEFKEYQQYFKQYFNLLTPRYKHLFQVYREWEYCGLVTPHF